MAEMSNKFFATTYIHDLNITHTLRTAKINRLLQNQQIDPNYLNLYFEHKHPEFYQIQNSSTVIIKQPLSFP